MSADEFWQYCLRPENEDRRLELTRGRVVEWPRPHLRHGVVTANVGFVLHKYAERTGAGYVTVGGVGVILECDPGTVRGPDVAFFTGAVDPSEDRWADDRPLLAIEVRSANDPPAEVAEKIADLVRCGVPDVWLVDYEDRTVTAHRRNAEMCRLGVADVVTSDALPGLAVPVADLFRLPAEKAAAR